MPEPAAYDERLRVPLRWWALATLFWASVLVAFLVATPVWVAVATTAALVVAGGGVLVGYGSARLRVGDGVLVAGRARIPVAELGEAEPLHRESMRLLAGREADVRAYLVLRPYLRRGVRVDVVDRGDPTPYWLLSTRHPDRLAQALASAREDASRLSLGRHQPGAGG
jgi:DUF3093 family protein